MAGWDDVSSRNLTQQQFRRAIFHVSGGFYIVVKEDKLQCWCLMWFFVCNRMMFHRFRVDWAQFLRTGATERADASVSHQQGRLDKLPAFLSQCQPIPVKG